MCDASFNIRYYDQDDYDLERYPACVSKPDKYLKSPNYVNPYLFTPISDKSDCESSSSKSSYQYIINNDVPCSAYTQCTACNIYIPCDEKIPDPCVPSYPYPKECSCPCLSSHKYCTETEYRNCMILQNSYFFRKNGYNNTSEAKYDIINNSITFYTYSIGLIYNDNRYNNDTFTMFQSKFSINDIIVFIYKGKSYTGSIINKYTNITEYPECSITLNEEKTIPVDKLIDIDESNVNVKIRSNKMLIIIE
jgi:hypothetical protein